MFELIYIILVDLCAFFFVGYGIYILNKKNPSTFLWNKAIKNIEEKNLKNYNKGISILYILFGLCFFIVGILSTYVSFNISRIALIFVLFIVIPILSTLQVFIISKWKKE
mgnify:CR=1 FL=1